MYITSLFWVALFGFVLAIFAVSQYRQCSVGDAVSSIIMWVRREFFQTEIVEPAPDYYLLNAILQALAPYSLLPQEQMTKPPFFNGFYTVPYDVVAKSADDLPLASVTAKKAAENYIAKLYPNVLVDVDFRQYDANSYVFWVSYAITEKAQNALREMVEMRNAVTKRNAQESVKTHVDKDLDDDFRNLR